MPLNAIAAVRRRECVTVRTMARHLGVTVREYRPLEEPHADLRLSELHRLAAAMGVPVQELVAGNEQDEIEKLRGLVLRTMKIANALCERLENDSPEHRLARSLRSQILAAMPETAGVGGVLAVGQRRDLNDLGRVAWHPVPQELTDYDLGDDS